MLLVTGGTGFIGSHLVDRLAGEGRPVRCLVRRTSQVSKLPRGVELAYADLASGQGLPEALRGVDTIIHLAGVTKARVPADYQAGNTTATLGLLRAAGDIRRLVHVSSLAAAGPSMSGGQLDEDGPPHPISEYGRSKLAAEQAVRQSPLWPKTIIVRPPVVYGPRDTDVYQVIRAATRGWIPRIGRAERRFSLIYVADLVAGLLAAAEPQHPAGRTYFIAHPEPVSWEQFGHTVARLAGRTARTITVPEGVAYAVGLWGELWTRLSGKPGVLSRDKVADACCPGWVCDPRRAQRELGIRAATSLEEGLRCTLQWYREAGWLKS
jgi:nucleoside-diphosphate-sugar epimerase